MPSASSRWRRFLVEVVIFEREVTGTSMLPSSATWQRVELAISTTIFGLYCCTCLFGKSLARPEACLEAPVSMAPPDCGLKALDELKVGRGDALAGRMRRSTVSNPVVS